MSGTHRGRGPGRGRSRGADRQDPTSRQEEQYQGHQTPKVPRAIIPDPRTIPSIHSTQHMTPQHPTCTHVWQLHDPEPTSYSTTICRKESGTK